MGRHLWLLRRHPLHPSIMVVNCLSRTPSPTPPLHQTLTIQRIISTRSPLQSLLDGNHLCYHKVASIALMYVIHSDDPHFIYFSISDFQTYRKALLFLEE